MLFEKRIKVLKLFVSLCNNANQGLKNKKNKSCCNLSKDMYS